jgi:hypothetical protein
VAEDQGPEDYPVGQYLSFLFNTVSEAELMKILERTLEREMTLPKPDKSEIKTNRGRGYRLSRLIVEFTKRPCQFNLAHSAVF